MRLLATILTLFLIPGLLWAANVFTVDDSGNITASGAWTNANAVEVNADVVLANDETIDNATDSEMRITFDDDAVLLGTLVIQSDNTGTSNEDSLFVDFDAKDDGGAITTYVRFDAEIDDVATPGEDGSLRILTLDEGSFITPLLINEFGLTLENGEILDNTTDAEVDVIFDNDQPALAEFSIESSVNGSAVEDNNTLDIDFAARDSGNTRTEYGTIRLNIDDQTDTTEDGALQFLVMAGGTETQVAEVDTAGLTVTGNVSSVHGSGVGSLSATGFEANDARLVLDADQGDDNPDTWFIESEAADNDLSFVNHLTEAFKITTAGAGTFTAGLTATSLNSGTGEATVDGKYAAVGPDATTPLMIQTGSKTGDAGTTDTNTFSVAFGAAPIVMLTYTANPATTNQPYIVSTATTQFVAEVAASKNYSWIAVGQRP